MKFMKIFVISVFFMLVSPFSSYSMVEEDLLVRALTATNVQIESFDVADWSVINRDFMEFSDMKKIAENVFRIFQTIDEKFTMTQESDNMYRVVILESLLYDGNYVRIVVQTVKLPEEFEKEPQTYLAISVTGSDVRKLKDMKQKVAWAVTSSGGQSRITTCLAGAIYGKLNRIEQDKIARRILEELKIKEVEKMEDLEMQNFIGYSPLIPDSLEIMGKKYNVNIAVRDSDQDDKTYIWLGVPVLSIEY
ncbi:hypothetical protein AN618_07740 [Fervidicola ferrireducens]|uniref:TATA-box binding protein n=2 Tax=Fervidicola ferrireducens TaxID=520764 RepID=A0A140LBP1_9FIRM|nr:hypothetical protein AN618_07740 [Fervidicola ferrireducens]